MGKVVGPQLAHLERMQLSKQRTIGLKSLGYNVTRVLPSKGIDPTSSRTVSTSSSSGQREKWFVVVVAAEGKGGNLQPASG